MRNSLTLLFCLSILRSMAQWGPPTTIARSELDQVYQSSVGDLDGDGDLDVITINDYPPNSSFYAYLNEGEWQFSTSFELDLSWDQEWTTWQLVDVDSDGRADLIKDGPEWYRNLGGLQFAEPQSLIDGFAGHLFCDLDGQYGLDLLLIDLNGNQGYSYAHQLPNGTYTEPEQFTDMGSGPNDFQGSPFHLLDLNGDGINDLLFIDSEEPGMRTLQVATGTAQGAFNAPQLYFTLGAGQGIRELTITDRDPSNGNTGFKLDLHTPNESIWFEPTIGLEYISTTTGLAMGYGVDLNGDGAQDLLCFDGGGPSVTIRLNDGSGTFADHQDVLTARGMLANGDHPADMDGDGDLDVVIRQWELDRMAILENDGSGTLNTRHEVAANAVPNPEQLDLVDLDGDGDLDLLTHSWNDIRVLFNDGAGGFVTRIILDEERRVSSFAHGDMDGDGDLDIIYTGYDEGVVLLLQGPSGQFTRQEIGVVLYGLRNSRLIDADLDGDLDVVVAEDELSTQTPRAFLIQNEGGGSFAPPVLLGDAQTFLMVCLVVDVNDDGLLDHVGEIGGTIGVTINAGGTFDAPILFDGTYGRPAHISDLNGDGLLDMIADAGGTLIIWHATTPFVFEAAQTVALLGGMEYADLRDIDGDGRLDLVQSFAQQVILQRCAPDGLFGQASLVWNFDLGFGFSSFAKAGDVSGDGNSDIIVGSQLSSRVELLTNLSSSDYQISGRIFHDLNGDQLYQPEEPPLPWVNLQVAPEASSPYTDVNGVYTVNATPGTYTLQPAVDPQLWTVTSTTPLQTTLTNPEPLAAGFDFAIVPAQEISLLHASMVQGTTACGDTTYLSLNIANAGTRVEQGTVILQLGQHSSFLSSTSTPSSVVGNTITWTFEELNFHEVRSIVAHVTTPSFGYIGEPWLHQLQVDALDDGGDILSTTNATLGGAVNCAYDPNDKQVYPAGYGEAGAIDLDTPYLDYTIRFQNTGTAPAFDVVIMDQLDADLDPERVEVLGFSHTPTQVAITANGSIQFKFLDIMLPDSATDQLGSQGFIHFRIHLREGLPHLTEIPNTAAIYFDLNPPIITNTVHSTLVDCNTWQPELEADTYGVLRAPAGDLYQWFLNGDPIPGAVADSIQLTTNGSYTVEVTSTLGCVATTPAIIATDIPETHMELGLMLVPNPFTRHARLIATTPLGTGGQVSLLDLHGRVLWTRATPGGPSLDLDFEGLAPGPYLLRVEQAGAAPRVLRALLQ